MKTKFKVGDIVETVVGVGRIAEVRDTHAETIYLITITEGGFGRGYSDVFGLDEFELFEEDIPFDIERPK